MTTTTSYSERGRFLGLYKSTFRRNIGFFALLCTVIGIFYPFQYAMEAFKSVDLAAEAIRYDNPYYQYSLGGLGLNYTGISAFFFSAIMLVAPLVLALVLNGYMHSKKAADVYHALPLRRETLLGVNFAVAMSMLWIPVIVSNLLISLLQIAKFGFDAGTFGYLWLDMLGWFAASATIYMVTAFVSVCVGTVFDAFVFACTLLISGPVLSGLFVGLCSEFLYGFTASDAFMRIIFLLSPLTLMPARFAFENPYAGIAPLSRSVDEISALTESNIAILVYLLLAAAFFFVTMKLYRKRPSETAETTTSKGILQILIKLIGTMISGICVGFVFYAISYPRGQMPFVMWTIIGGILAYAIIEVILNRGFKTLVKSLPLGVLMVAVTVGGTLIPMTGAFGYETRVPDTAKVTSAEINYTGRYDGYAVRVGPDIDYDGDLRTNSLRTVTLTDPQAIDAIRAFHTDAVAKGYDRAGYMEDSDVPVMWTNTEITYRLQGGGKLTRTYNAVDAETMSKLAPLETNAEFLTQRHPAFFTDPANIIEWEISDLYGKNRVKHLLSPADSSALLEAIRTDLSAMTLDELRYPTETPVAYLSFTANLPKTPAERAARSGQFLISSEKQQTYQFLKQKGLLSGIEVDLDDCVAVSAIVDNGAGGGRYRNNYSAIAQMSPGDYQFSAQELEYTRENIRSERENWTEEAERIGMEEFLQSRGRYEVTALFENPGDIQAMADAMVGSYAVGEPLVYANFYFDGAATGTPVLVPLSRLPEHMRSQFEMETFLKGSIAP